VNAARGARSRARAALTSDDAVNAARRAAERAVAALPGDDASTPIVTAETAAYLR